MKSSNLLKFVLRLILLTSPSTLYNVYVADCKPSENKCFIFQTNRFHIKRYEMTFLKQSPKRVAISKYILIKEDSKMIKMICSIRNHYEIASTFFLRYKDYQ